METNKLIIVFILLISFTSCNGLFLNKSRNIRLAKKYKKECLKKTQNTHNDTIQLKSNRVCIKEKNKKFSIGRIKNDSQFGIWYYYKKKANKYNCYLIKKKMRNDSIIIYSSSIVNYRKW